MSTGVKAEKIVGRDHTGAVAVSGDFIPLGTPDPDNSARRRVRCLNHPGGPFDRFVSIPGAGRLSWAEIKTAGWIKPCRSCALRETDPLPLATGSIIYRGERDETGKYARARCGICDHDKHYVSLSLGANQTGFCPACQPWAAVALNAELLAGPSRARAAVYARIVRVRRLLEGDAAQTAAGSAMPFWVLVKKYVELYPGSDPQSPGAPSAHRVRHLLLFFEDQPIGQIGRKEAEEFKAEFLRGAGRRGGEQRRPSTARSVVEMLRALLGFAKGEGWIRVNPFRRGVAVGSKVPLYKSDRLVTVEEEAKLHAACVGNFAYLRAVLTYVADAPAYLRDLLKLNWSDVNFEDGIVPGHESAVANMTPRLRAELRKLWEQSERKPGSPVISRSVDQCNYDFEKVRAAAGVEGPSWSDIRRTGAWRLERAGRDVREVAAALGMTHLDNVAELLQVNPVIAQQEIASQQFQTFIREQFGAPAQAQYGNGQKNGDSKVWHRPRDNRDQWLFAAVDKLAIRWKEVIPYKVAGRADLLRGLKLEYVASDIGITTDRLGKQLGECKLANIFPDVRFPFQGLAAFVADGVDRGLTSEEIFSNLMRRRESAIVAPSD